MGQSPGLLFNANYRYIVPTKILHARLAVGLTSTFLVGTLHGMDTKQRKRGRPKKNPERAKADYLDIRLETAEKQAFRDAAELAGLDLSAWVRERLRATARKELEAGNRPVAFLARFRMTSTDGSSVDG
jgi:uncharacterized protein (DUF1778 family)